MELAQTIFIVIQGAAAGIAVIVAGIAYLTERSGIHDERKDRSRRRRQDEMHQATKLSAWMARELEEGGLEHARADGKYISTGLILSNDSEGSFHDLEIHVTLGDPKKDVEVKPSVKVLPPGRYYAAGPQSQSSGSAWHFPQDIEALRTTFSPYAGTDRFKVLSVTFTDSLNQRWHMDVNGKLTYLKDIGAYGAVEP